MIEFVKVEKDGVKKSVEKQLLRQYISAGWKEVKEVTYKPTSNPTYSYNTNK